jgi:hypothetical protein
MRGLAAKVVGGLYHAWVAHWLRLKWGASDWETRMATEVKLIGTRFCMNRIHNKWSPKDYPVENV